MSFRNKLLVVVVGVSALLAGNADAQQRQATLEKTETFPVTREFTLNTGQPLSVIETGVITDSLGQMARGPHRFIFTLDESSPYPVVVRGETIQPGGSHEFVQNLTTSGGEFSAPIFPATDGVIGVADYTLTVPELYIQACPDSFTETDSGCYRVQYTAADFQCDQGESFNEQTLMCERPDTIASLEYCDDPFQVGLGKCVNEFTVDPVTNCPEGYEVIGNQCATISTTGRTGCPGGYTFEGGKCYTYQPATETCPSGQVTLNGQCYQTTGRSSSCPAGYSPSGSRCEKQSKHSPTGCPRGYYTIGGSCYERKFVRVGSAVCPSGYPDYKPVTDACYTSDYDFDAGTGDWYRVQNSDYARFCPSSHPVLYQGDVGQSSCRASSPSNVGSCPSGMTYNTSTRICQGPVYKNRVSSCPSGYTTYNSSTCRSTSSAGTSSFLCNDQTHTVKVGQQCRSNYEYGNVGNCPSGYSIDGSSSTCQKVETLPSPVQIDSCPQGYVNESGRCHELVNNEEVCPSGYTDNGSNCQRTDTTSVKVIGCPSGYRTSKSVGSQCYRISSQPVQCPAGYDLVDFFDGCENSSGDLIPYSCAAGYMIASGYRCLDSGDSQPKVSGCPSGYTQSGSTCTRVRTASKTVSCPSGSVSYDASQCKMTTADTSVGECPKGYNINESTGQCENNSEDIMGCEGYEDADSNTLDGNQCIVRYEKELGYICPEATPEYNMSEDQLTCDRLVFEDPDISCPTEEGYTYSTEEQRCLKEDTADFVNGL